MNAYSVFIAVRLALGMDGGHGNHGGVERVDALMWRSASMRRPAEQANMFGNEANVRAPIGDSAVFGLGARSVRHHGEIDVIEGTQANKLWLATEKLEFPLPAQLIAIGDLNVLLSRHGQQRHPPCQLGQHAGLLEPYPHRQHHGNLTVMSAGMRGSSSGVSMRMLQHFERVEFAHHRNGGAGIAGLEHALEAGKSNAVLKGDTKLAKLASREL